MATGAGHAGDLSPEQAMELLTGGEGAVLVDVRTHQEWDTIGVPDLSSLHNSPVFVEWVTAPAMAPNPDFATALSSELEKRGATSDTPILFICRSGARSTAAANALASRGFTRSYNVAGGFEGSPAAGLPGWRKTGLPSSASRS